MFLTSVSKYLSKPIDEMMLLRRLTPPTIKIFKVKYLEKKIKPETNNFNFNFKVTVWDLDTNFAHTFAIGFFHRGS